MKHHRSLSGLLAFALAGLVPALALAQTELPASVVGSGGGTATSTNYSLTGTVGQAAAGNLTGGAFDHDAGYWPAANALSGAALAGLLLLVLGCLFLLSNFGIFGWLSWGRLWPVLLILLGVALLVRRR